MQYAVVVEKADDCSYSAYVPDLPGCVSCGDSVEEVQHLIQEAIRLHMDSLRSHNEPVPEARSTVCLVEV
jgi:predicted RNase H-like HicB family nuclease